MAHNAFHLKTFLRRELYVATHAQQRWVRIVKYPVFFCLAGLFSVLYGWRAVLIGTAAVLIIGLVLHFLVRWKTNGWRKSWGLYRAIPIPDER